MLQAPVSETHHAPSQLLLAALGVPLSCRGQLWVDLDHSCSVGLSHSALWPPRCHSERRVWKRKGSIMNPCGSDPEWRSGNSYVISSPPYPLSGQFQDSHHKFSQKFPQDRASSARSSRQFSNTSLYSLPPPPFLFLSPGSVFLFSGMTSLVSGSALEDIQANTNSSLLL